MKKAISILLAVVFLQSQAYGQLGFLNLSYSSVKTIYDVASGDEVGIADTIDQWKVN